MQIDKIEDSLKPPEKWHSGCNNEQQADFEVQLENRITVTRH